LRNIDGHAIIGTNPKPSLMTTDRRTSLRQEKKGAQRPSVFALPIGVRSSTGGKIKIIIIIVIITIIVIIVIVVITMIIVIVIVIIIVIITIVVIIVIIITPSWVYYPNPQRHPDYDG
jgi:Flp pilus assembly protein TadB